MEKGQALRRGSPTCCCHAYTPVHVFSHHFWCGAFPRTLWIVLPRNYFAGFSDDNIWINRASLIFQTCSRSADCVSCFFLEISDFLAQRNLGAEMRSPRGALSAPDGRTTVFRARKQHALEQLGNSVVSEVITG